MPAVSDIDISASLTQDYFQTRQIKGAPDRALFAASELLSQNKSAHHMVMFDVKNSFTHIYQDIKSPSGWTTQTVTLDPIDEASTLNEIKLFASGDVLIMVIMIAQEIVIDHESRNDVEFHSNNRVLCWSQTQPWQPIQVDGLPDNSPSVDAYGQFLNTTNIDFYEDDSDPSACKNYMYAVFPNYDPQYPLVRVSILECPRVSGAKFVIKQVFVDHFSDYHQFTSAKWLVRYAGPSRFCIIKSTTTDIFHYENDIDDNTINPTQGSITFSKSSWANTIEVKSLVQAIQVDLAGQGSGFVFTDGAKFILENGSGVANSQTRLIEAKSAWQETLPAFTRIVAGRVPSVGTVLFATDKDRELWVSRPQDDGTVAQNWVPLGNVATAFACPQTMNDGAEVYFFDAAGFLFRLHQTAQDSAWATDRIEIPLDAAAAPREVSALNVRITTVDDKHRPLPFQAVTIQTDQAFTARVNGTVSRVTPSAALTLTSDQSGDMSLVMEPTSFASAPKLTVTSGTASRWVQFDNIEVKSSDRGTSSASSVARRLSGADPNFEVSNAAMTKAGLLQDRFKDVAGVVDAVKSAGALLALHAPAEKKRDAPAAGNSWKLDFTPGAALYTAVTQEEADQHFQTVFGDVADRKRWWGSDAWEKVTETVEGVTTAVEATVGDALQYVAETADEVKSVAVHAIAEVADATLLVVTTVENEVEKTTNVVLTTAKHAGAVVDTIFDRLGEAVVDAATTVVDAAIDVANKALDWVRDQLGWTDILVAHKIFKEMTNQLLDLSKLKIDESRTIFDSLMDRLQTFIDTNYQSIKENLKDKTISNLQCGPGPNDKVGNLPDLHSGGKHYKLYTENRSTLDFVINKISSGGVEIEDRNSISTKFPQWTPSASQSSQLNDLQTKAENAWSRLSGGGAGGDITDKILTTGLDTLADICYTVSSAALTAGKSIGDALFDFASSVISNMKSILNAKINVPILNYIYKNVITYDKDTGGDDLTILDLICLITAVPAVLLYKLFNNDKAPFADISANITLVRQFFAINPNDNSDHKRDSTLLQGVADFIKGLNKVAPFLSIVGMAYSTVLNGLAYVDAYIRKATAKDLSAPRFAMIQDAANSKLLQGKDFWSPVNIIGLGSILTGVLTNLFTTSAQSWGKIFTLSEEFNVTADGWPTVMYVLCYLAYAIDMAVFFKTLQPELFSDSGIIADTVIGLFGSTFGFVAFIIMTESSWWDRVYALICYWARVPKIGLCVVNPIATAESFGISDAALAAAIILPDLILGGVATAMLFGSAYSQ